LHSQFVFVSQLSFAVSILTKQSKHVEFFLPTHHHKTRSGL
jgi:hypothetical protein